MELKGKKLNFLGDSITEGCGASDTAHRFTELIAADTGMLVRNYGIGGTRIARQTVPSAEPVWDRDFAARAGEMDPDADAVGVLGGTNDYGHGDAPLGAPDSRDPYTFCGALNLMCETLLRRYPGKLVFLCTPLHRDGENDLRNGFGVRNVCGLEGYVELIRRRAAFYGLPVLDLYAECPIQPAVPELRERFTADGLHPNDAGYRLIANQIEAFLRTR